MFKHPYSQIVVAAGLVEVLTLAMGAVIYLSF